MGKKAIKMAAALRVRLLGIVENMSYAVCPHCGEKLELFGQSHLEETAMAFGIRVSRHMPLDPLLC